MIFAGAFANRKYGRTAASEKVNTVNLVLDKGAAYIIEGRYQEVGCCTGWVI